MSDEYSVSDVRSDILDREQRGYIYTAQYVEAVYGEGVLGENTVRDFLPLQELKGQREGRFGKENNSNRREYKSGIGSVGENNEIAPIKEASSQDGVFFDAKNSGAKYSLSDSDGKKLTTEQQEYFKDSKVRDENGNLKVMFHGTPKGGNAIGISPYLSDAEYNKIKTIDWTEGEDLREFLIDNGYDYDGLVLDEGATGGYGEEVQSRGTSYVVFSPHQAKETDNVTPTTDPDIRYSLTEYDENEQNRKSNEGELVNDFYTALDRKEWREYYRNVAETGNLTAGIGDKITTVVGDKLILSERKKTGSNSNDFQVYVVYQLSGADAFDMYEIKDSIDEILGSGEYSDYGRIEKALFSIVKRIGQEQVFRKFDRNNLLFDFSNSQSTM